MGSDNSGHTVMSVVDLDSEVGAGGVVDIPPVDGLPVGSTGYGSATFGDQLGAFTLVLSRQSGNVFLVVPSPLGPVALVTSPASGVPVLFASRILATINLSGVAMNAGRVILASPTQTPAQVAAIDAVTTEGAVVARSAFSGGGFDVAELVAVPGQDAMSPLNLVLVRSATSGARIFSAGRQIYALLQEEATGANGVAFDNVVSGNRAKLSFVRANATETALELVPLPEVSLTGAAIQFQYLQRLQSTKLPEYALAPVGF